MTNELVKSFCDEHKVKKIYAYHEKKNGSNIEFGWVMSDSIQVDEGVILSYPSRTRKTKEEKAWSDKEGVTATSLSDYKSFFTASTGYEPEKFIELSDDVSGSFVEVWLKNNAGYTEDSFVFLASLATLIIEGKSFNMFGRGFKVISP
jgi:hypothetical protein